MDHPPAWDPWAGGLDLHSIVLRMAAEAPVAGSPHDLYELSLRNDYAIASSFENYFRRELELVRGGSLQIGPAAWRSLCISHYLAQCDRAAIGNRISRLARAATAQRSDLFF